MNAPPVILTLTLSVVKGKGKDLIRATGSRAKFVTFYSDVDILEEKP